MPNPEDVNPNKFTVESVLFDHNDFSISYGTWNPTGNKVIGMRWNEGDDGSGYPKAFGNPQWFVISDDIVKSVLGGLISSSLLTPKEYQSIVGVLKQL